MFRSLMTIIRELYMCLTEFIFMLKQSVKSHRYINYINTLISYSNIFLIFWYFNSIYDDNQFICHC